MEQPGAYYETQDRLVTFNPDVVNPLLAGLTNPVTGQPYLGAFELVASDAQPERTLRKNPLQFAPRVGVAYRITDNTVVRAGGGTFYGAFDSPVSRWADTGNSREQQNQQHRDQCRQQPHVLHRSDQPVPDRGGQLSGPRRKIPAGAASGGPATSSTAMRRGTPDVRSSSTWPCSISSPRTCRSRSPT